MPLARLQLHRCATAPELLLPHPGPAYRTASAPGPFEKRIASPTSIYPEYGRYLSTSMTATDQTVRRSHDSEKLAAEYQAVCGSEETSLPLPRRRRRQSLGRKLEDFLKALAYFLDLRPPPFPALRIGVQVDCFSKCPQSPIAGSNDLKVCLWPPQAPT